MDDYPDDDAVLEEVEEMEARVWFELDRMGERWVYETREEE